MQREEEREVGVRLPPKSFLANENLAASKVQLASADH